MTPGQRHQTLTRPAEPSLPKALDSGAHSTVDTDARDRAGMLDRGAWKPWDWC